MSLRPSALVALLVPLALASALSSQAAPRPQPYCVRGVSLTRDGTRKGTLILRDGAILAVLDEAAPAPPGSRVIDGTGLICLPAFLDAYARQGLTVPEPVVDRDLPPDLQADVGIDMRLANRKGIQPGFRAVEALTIAKEQAEAWRKSGFGAALLAPGGELLAGESVLASTREAAMRDVVVRESVFTHAAFAAAGRGYPSTLMGYFAQLRQFFLDSQHQAELVERRAEGRPGPRPPFDADLAAGEALLRGDRALVCEASAADDILRWLRLADEFGLRLDVVGGNEAWRVTDVLAARKMTVVLTLDWGKEVKDPRPKEAGAEEETADKVAAEKETAKTDEDTPPEAGEAPEASAEAEETSAKEPETKAAEAVWEYDEPYLVRLERRKKWEELRDCALRLEEAGVNFVFGSASEKPSELLANVRALVKAGLPAEHALAALTDEAAHFLGVGRRLGAIEPGFDATFALWRADPLTDEKASVAWIFVDGFPSEYKEEKKKAPSGDGPAEGLDPSGTWKLDFVAEEEGIKSATLKLAMGKDGSVTGTLEVENPMGGGTLESAVEGELAGTELTLGCTLTFGQFSIETKLTAELEGESLDGDGSFHGPWSDEPTSQKFHGARKPK